MLNPQTEIKFSDYNSLYDILNPTVNGFRDFSLSFLIDYKAGASLFSGTNYSLYSEGLHKGTLLGRTVDNPGGSGFIGAGVMIDDNGKILLFLSVAQRLSNQWPYNISVILHHKQ